MNLRQAQPDDQPAIALLLTAAFGQPAEALLVESLRAEGAMALELVVERRGNGLWGYLALSQMRSPVGWLALAPVAVAPSQQRQGVGSALILGALEMTDAPVVVVGEPGYYARFGFSVDRAARLTSPYPPEFTALHQRAPEGDAPAEVLVYATAFGS
ncbi:putative acetyltransferase [Rhodovulum iodosum]|uniref:Acetyltransferase n=1 Tax=Rhodovulum iodosum TaxID=68291 RepID=A0ABV3XT61_9RHOB|nr:N-acetyltransferase [Rhodovulum robiginosum]RSK30694.1 N-acetyltransferase [Rhodovulum robiginosum]